MRIRPTEPDPRHLVCLRALSAERPRTLELPEHPTVRTRTPPAPAPTIRSLAPAPEPAQRGLARARDDRALHVRDADDGAGRGRHERVRRLVHAREAREDVRRHRVRRVDAVRRGRGGARGVARGEHEVQVASVARGGREQGGVRVVHDDRVHVFEGLQARELGGDRGALLFEVWGVLGVRVGEGGEVALEEGDAVVGLGGEDDVGESVIRLLGAAVYRNGWA